MGGAAGHMAHPFDLPFVKTGSDLIDFFESASDILSAESMSVKIDGVNVSFKVVGDEDNKQFAVDRGSTKPIDIEGVTIARVGERFPEGHGMLSAVSDLLTILNTSIEDVKSELQELGMWDNPSIFLNTEYVVGTTNVTQYDQNFLAIHGVNEFYQKTNQRTGVTRPGTKRPEGATGPSIEVGYDPAVLERFAEKLRPVAAEKNFEVFTSVPTSKIEEMDIDFSGTLSEPLTVVFSEEDEITKSLGEWLQESQNPKGIDIKIQDGDKLKKIAALSKQVYLNILNGTPITSFIPNKEDVQPAIEAAVFYHATRQLGNDVLKALTSPMGDVTSHEGVVIRHKSFGPNPVKITGEFIVGGMVSGFRESLADSLREFSINDDSGYTAPQKKKNQVIALFPGAFRPPTRGHLFAATSLMNQSDIMKVLISSPKSESSKRRVGTKEITPEISKKIWELYGIPTENVQITDSPSPVRAVFEFLEDPMLAPPGTTIMLGCSTKGGDEVRWDNAAAYAKKVRGDEIKVVTSACPPERHTDDYEELLSALEDFARNNLPSIQKGKDPMNIHGSDMRHLALMALEGDQELTNLFKHFLPSNIDHEGVLKLLSSGPSEEVRESFSLPFLYTLVEEVLNEVSSEEQRTWACAQIKNPDELTVDQAEEMCSAKIEEEELEEMSSMAGGSVSGYSGAANEEETLIRQENKNYKLFTIIEEKGSTYMTNREDILAEQLLREIVRKAIRKTQKKVLKEEQMLRRAVRSLLKEETAKQTIYPYTSLNVLSEFIKNQVYKPTSNFKAAYMTLSSNKEDRERFLQHILDLAKEDMSRMDMNLEPLLDPGKELKAKETELDTAEEETEEDDGPIVVTMDDLDAKGGVLGDEEEVAPGEEQLQEEDDEVFNSDTEVERDAVRNFANETYKGFGAALRRFYERVPDNVVKVNIEGQEQNIAERELFAIYLEKNLIAHASMAEQYMDSESNLTTDVPSAESDENDLGFGDEAPEEELDLDF